MGKGFVSITECFLHGMTQTVFIWQKETVQEMLQVGNMCHGNRQKHELNICWKTELIFLKKIYSWWMMSSESGLAQNFITL